MAARNQKKPVGIAGLYDLEETIGKGHYAVVKLARHVFTGERVAVKVIDKTKLDSVSTEQLRQEVLCMKLVQHPHVVKLYEVIDTETKLYLILELGDGGDMYDYIMKHDRGLEERWAQKYFRQIVQAINYCHKLHVVHRDLKPENVVFFEKLEMVKLTDFGFSNKFVPGKPLDTSCGSLAYSAPEILLGDNYDPPAVDVWSLGVILYMLVVGNPPFQEANDSETLTMILDCKYSIPEHVSDLCRNLISRMLVREPLDRITLDDILLHQWMIPTSPLEESEALPLITTELLGPEDKKFIIKKMIEGKIATKDDIISALQGDGYNHITATFFLLAERHLKRQQQQEHHQLQIHKVTTPMPITPDGKQPLLSPLSLSPRGLYPESASQEKTSQPVNPLVSPVVMRCLDANLMPCEKPDEDPVTKSSNLEWPQAVVHDFGNTIFEDPMEEDSEDWGSELGGFATRGSMEWRSQRSRDDTSTSEGESSDHSRSSSLERGDSNTKPTKIGPRRTLRPLKTVRSSPNMLNEICEESENEVDGKLSKLHPPSYVENTGHSAEADIIRRKREPRRGTSCSSSDASDEENEHGKKRSKDKNSRHKGLPYRRDSSDHSSDTDAGASAGGFGGGSSASTNNTSTRSSKPRSSGGNRYKRSNQSGHNSKGTVLAQSIIPEESISERSSPGRAGGNRASSVPKYIPSNGPIARNIKPTLVDLLNQENRYQSHVINVRSKNFADLVNLFQDDNSMLEKVSMTRVLNKPGEYDRRKKLLPPQSNDAPENFLHTEAGRFEVICPGRVLLEHANFEAKVCSLG